MTFYHRPMHLKYIFHEYNHNRPSRPEPRPPNNPCQRRLATESAQTPQSFFKLSKPLTNNFATGRLKTKKVIAKPT